MCFIIQPRNSHSLSINLSFLHPLSLYLSLTHTHTSYAHPHTHSLSLSLFQIEIDDVTAFLCLDLPNLFLYIFLSHVELKLIRFWRKVLFVKEKEMWPALNVQQMLLKPFFMIEKEILLEKIAMGQKLSSTTGTLHSKVCPLGSKARARNSSHVNSSMYFFSFHGPLPWCKLLAQGYSWLKRLVSMRLIKLGIPLIPL